MQCLWSPVALEIIFCLTHGSTVWPQPVSEMFTVKKVENVDKAFAPDELIADKVDGKQITIARTRTNFGNWAWKWRYILKETFKRQKTEYLIVQLGSKGFF